MSRLADSIAENSLQPFAKRRGARMRSRRINIICNGVAGRRKPISGVKHKMYIFLIGSSSYD